LAGQLAERRFNLARQEPQARQEIVEEQRPTPRLVPAPRSTPAAPAPSVRPRRTRDRFRRALPATREWLVAGRAGVCHTCIHATDGTSFRMLALPLIDLDIGACGDFHSRRWKLCILKDNHDDS
jgi:hypothetical protein